MRITNFEIRNFRAFDRLCLTGLKQVNLIAGKNNVGKTALLEALSQFAAPDQPDIGLRLDQFRGIQQINPEELLLSLFHRYDDSKPIELTATGDWGGR